MMQTMDGPNIGYYEFCTQGNFVSNPLSANPTKQSDNEDEDEDSSLYDCISAQGMQLY